MLDAQIDERVERPQLLPPALPLYWGQAEGVAAALRTAAVKVWPSVSYELATERLSFSIDVLFIQDSSSAGETHVQILR